MSETDVPKISLSDIHEIFHDKTSERSKKVEFLKIKIDKLVDEGLWEPCDVLPHVDNNNEPNSIRDCIIYYVCGYVTKQILKKKKCVICIDFLKNGNSNHPAADLVHLKSKGSLLHPNIHLFNFLNVVEDCFSKHCHSYDVFLNVIDEITDSNVNFKFTCALHFTEVATEIIVYYLQMRLRQFSYQENLKFKKVSREKKKISKLHNT